MKNKSKWRKEDVVFMKGKFKRYDVVLIDFKKNTIGSEQGGIRPAIIIQNDKGNTFSNTTIVMPCTSQIKHLHQPTHALLKRNKENGLPFNSMILAECLRQVSEERIIKKLGNVADKIMQDKIKEIYIANFEG